MEKPFRSAPPPPIGGSSASAPLVAPPSRYLPPPPTLRSVNSTYQETSARSRLSSASSIGTAAQFLLDPSTPSLRLPTVSPFRAMMGAESTTVNPDLIPATPVPASNKLSSPSTDEEPDAEFRDLTLHPTSGQLPRGWGVGETPQGTAYYFRLGTTSTTWEHPNITALNLFEDKMKSISVRTFSLPRSCVSLTSFSLHE